MQGSETTEGAPTPAVDTWLVQERRQGRHTQTYDWWATVLTYVHQSWLRRDLWWALLPALLAAVCNPR